MTTSSAESFHYEKHVKYIKKVASDTESFEFLVSQYLRLSGVYWGMTAMSILGKDMNVDMDGPGIVEWVLTCQDPVSGGLGFIHYSYIFSLLSLITLSYVRNRFGGSAGHDPHILYTLSALQVLLLCDQLGRIDIEKVASFVASLQNADGSFKGDEWGEVDTRFSYCALSSLSILGKLNSGIINLPKAVDFISRYGINLSFKLLHEYI